MKVDFFHEKMKIFKKSKIFDLLEVLGNPFPWSKNDLNEVPRFYIDEKKCFHFFPE